MLSLQTGTVPFGIATAMAAALAGCSPEEAPLIGPPESVSSGGAGPTSCQVEFLTDDSRIPATLAFEYLSAMNERRFFYCLDTLQWDCDLARVAQDFAEQGAGDIGTNDQRDAQYAALTGCTDCPTLGENVGWHAPYDAFPLTDPVTSWLSGEDPTQCNTGSPTYTQIVWEAATRVGCGIFIDDNDGGKLHAVCDFDDIQGAPPSFPIGYCTSCL